MRTNRKHKGFSLAEVLLAIGTLAVGVLFVAGVFPVGIHLTTVAIERTIAAIAADEAFAKIKLYAKDDTDPNRSFNFSGLVTNQLEDFDNVLTPSIGPDEFTYPSTDVLAEQKHYYWTALCRRVDANSLNNRLVQVTVFVCRKVSPNLRYWDRDQDDDKLEMVDYPVPVKVKVSQASDYELLIEDLNPPPDDQVDEKAFVNDGYAIVDDTTGRIYRVLERYASPRDNTILLDRNWESGATAFVWVVPPPVTGGRGPCIGVYQKVIRF